MAKSTVSVPQPMPPFLGGPQEICIVTAGLRETLIGLVRLGIGPFKIYNFTPETVTEQSFRGEPASFSIDVAFAEQRNPQTGHTMVWEVMQHVEGLSIMKEFLDQTNGKGGIQHVAFDCANNQRPTGKGTLIGEKARQEARRRKNEFESRGFPLVQSGIWQGRRGTCEFMFFDTQGAVGICFESYVFSDDWEDPEEVEHFPASV